MSLKLKLARLSAPPSLAAREPPRSLSTERAPPQRTPIAPGLDPGRRPSLDDLRERIARIIGRSAPPAGRASPAAGELPFQLERTPSGPLYVRRVISTGAARVGRVPLVGARDADPAMLALLALDPALASCDPRRALFVDTETTGLAGGTGTVPFLLGLAWFDPVAGAFVLEQALLRRLGEEAPILELFASRLAAASMIVSYNGKSFDLPLLRTRFVMNRLAGPPEPPHLDLVHVARRVHARLRAKTLAAIESEVLGRARIDDVSGGDIVACYAHFLRTGDEASLLGVVEHNAADVLSMVALVGLYGEPLGGLGATDLAGVARTLQRARALDLAADLAEQAVLRGGGADARRARGDIAKARGDKARALVDYEVLAADVDDPAVRLELVKLYEHHARAFDRALELLERGTGEAVGDVDRRRARLARKAERAQARRRP